MTTTEDPRLSQARDMLSSYGAMMSPRQLADFLQEKTTDPVRARIRRHEFPAIDKGNGRYSIPTDTLAHWLADRLTITPLEDQ